MVEYRFARPQTALLFDTQHGRYRVDHWRSLDEGAELVHLSGLDGMFFDTPVRSARFRIRTPKDDVPGAAPFIRFSDGSEAFYSGQLALLTVESRAAAAALKGNLRRWKGTQPPVQVRVAGSETVTAHRGGGPYVYAGTIPRSTVGGAVAVVDPGLPKWLAARLVSDLESIEKAVQRRWKEPLPATTYLLAWGGSSDAWSNRGRATRGQISMAIRGTRYLKPNDTAIRDLLWFFAHERTHHLQLASQVRIGQWLLEGGADAMATVILADLGLLSAKETIRRYARVFHNCAKALEGITLDAVRGKGAYACGELVFLATTQIVPADDVFEWWKTLLSATKAQKARLDGSFYRFVLGKQRVAPSGLAALRRFTTERHTTPRTSILALLRAVGMAPVYDDAKGLMSLKLEPFARP